MRIQHFSISGYKNLTDTVVMDDLGDVVVIHGPNNVGKSNLLEAIALPFILLGLGGTSRTLPFEDEVEAPRDELAVDGYAPRDIFNLHRPQPIDFRMELVISADELRAHGITDVHSADPLRIRGTLRPGTPNPSWKLHSFQFADGHDAVGTQDPELQRRVRKFSLFLARNYLVGGGGNQRGFQVLTPSASLPPRAGVPEKLSLKLYDLQDALDREELGRWELFRELMAPFADEVGASTFRVVYDRKAEAAELVAEHAGTRIPARLLGTGIQQLLVLIGALVSTRTSVVAIEEPEANLAYTVQLKLRDLLRQLVEDPRGPEQLFFTSHSPGFQIGDSFYALRRGPSGAPVLSRQPATMAARTTGLRGMSVPPDGETAPLSYVTPSGLVLIPEFVREHLGLTNGGGVGFVRDDLGARILTDAQASAALGLDDEE